MNGEENQLEGGVVASGTRDGVVGVHPEQIKSLFKSQDIILYVLLILIATLFFALGAIFNDYLAMKQATYQDLRDEIEEQKQVLLEMQNLNVTNAKTLENLLEVRTSRVEANAQI
jgi:hypothetical protein